ncbi:hypothetical protein KM043_009097 [Ampulex compressa]|nr:hypothetical protein KM043_009097 [Ampulex compressa]
MLVEAIGEAGGQRSMKGHSSCFRRKGFGALRADRYLDKEENARSGGRGGGEVGEGTEGGEEQLRDTPKSMENLLNHGPGSSLLSSPDLLLRHSRRRYRNGRFG